MPIKHNAASEAVLAKPCPKTPDADALSTLRQTMLMALAVVQEVSGRLGGYPPQG